MLLDIIIIVLRETLEASILIAVLLSISLNRNVKMTWLPPALLVGSVGAIVYGSSLGAVSEWFDYAGQEVVNAALQVAVYLLICWLISLQSPDLGQSLNKNQGAVRVLMVVIVATAFVREGGELYVFYGGFLQKGAVLLPALISGFIGLAIGLSAGAIVYYGLVLWKQVKWLSNGVLTLVAGGMVLQATQLLLQIDWLSSSGPLWDSGWLISESSVIGQVLYAIFGYEATPSDTEVGAYLAAVVGIIVVVNVSYRRRNYHRTGLKRA